MNARKLGIAVSAAIAMSAATGAGAVTINAEETGWYTTDPTVVQTAVEKNYVVGDALSGLEFRDFFIFDLSGVSGTVTAATLRIFNPAEIAPGIGGYLSPDASEIVDFHHVGTSSAVLKARGDQAAAFADLADGATYGTHVATPADNGTFVSIALNGAALANITAALGADFSVGGSMVTLDSPGESEFFFGFSLGTPGSVQLILEGDLTVAATPEPGSLALIGLGALALGALRRRRRH